jgi:hypothetical protein
MNVFTLAAALSAAGVGAIYALSGFSMGISFALCLFALCLAGYAALNLLSSSGFEGHKAAALYALAAFAAYFAAILAFGAYSSAMRFSFLPFLICLPAASAAFQEGFIR